MINTLQDHKIKISIQKHSNTQHTDSGSVYIYWKWYVTLNSAKTPNIQIHNYNSWIYMYNSAIHTFEIKLWKLWDQTEKSL